MYIQDTSRSLNNLDIQPVESGLEHNCKWGHGFSSGDAYMQRDIWEWLRT